MKKICSLILIALTFVCIISCGGNKYTITLKAFDSETTITAKKDEVVELEAVEYDGYLFIGWYNKNDELIVQLRQFKGINDKFI